MKVKVIFTGGTIGSRIKEEGYIAPKEKAPYELIDQYRKTNPDNIEFDTVEPYCILSENISAKEWNQLIVCVRMVLLEEQTDGIVITHGTDTLAYSAAMLSYVFGYAEIPILLVSSDFPLEDERANGHINFYYAIKFMQERLGRGVFVSYCNKGGQPAIHRGGRLLQHKAFSADVESIKKHWYGAFEHEQFVFGERGKNPTKSDVEQNEKKERKEIMFQESEMVKLSSDAGEILRIVPSVGMKYPPIGEEVKAVLHESYHSGTIGINKELEKFVKEAKRRNIPIYVTGLTGEEAVYETVEEYKKLGMIPLFDVAPVAQYCKLWLALSNHKDLSRVMAKKFYGE